MENNIVLIGMPACGKTTIGKLLAEILTDYTLIDTDYLIEKTEGLKITEIFNKYSEDYFRKLEHDTIELLCKGSKKIISIGGGAFENPSNRAALLKFGTVFYLKTNIDVLYLRIAEDKTRPLLQKNNPKQILKELLEKRESNYQKAHYTIDTNTLSCDEVIRFIINATNSNC